MTRWIAVFTLLGLFVSTGPTRAGGISADAGLTPAEDRLIIRTQFRFMSRGDDPTMMNRQMDMYAAPVVVAYGLHPALTIMARQMIMHRSMTMAGATLDNTGFGDLMLMAKYRALRINTPGYTLGISPTLGVLVPVGESPFSAEAWGVRAGIYVSGRLGHWAADINFAYLSNGVAGVDDTDIEPGDEISAVAALARQIALDSRGHYALAPVLEVSYVHEEPAHILDVEVDNTGESAAYVAPGAKLTVGSTIFEALLQVPVWQDQTGAQTERNAGLIVGLRQMF